MQRPVDLLFAYLERKRAALEFSRLRFYDFHHFHHHFLLDLDHGQSQLSHDDVNATLERSVQTMLLLHTTRQPLIERDKINRFLSS